MILTKTEVMTPYASECWRCRHRTSMSRERQVWSGTDTFTVIQRGLDTPTVYKEVDIISALLFNRDLRFDDDIC